VLSSAILPGLTPVTQLESKSEVEYVMQLADCGLTHIFTSIVYAQCDGTIYDRLQKTPIVTPKTRTVQSGDAFEDTAL
jgi:hypothetical protein